MWRPRRRVASPSVSQELPRLSFLRRRWKKPPVSAVGGAAGGKCCVGRACRYCMMIPLQLGLKGGRTTWQLRVSTTYAPALRALSAAAKRACCGSSPHLARPHLAVPEGDIRPTPDRVRETLFNWLAPDITGARCLDLFAGSGALGLEALSRGAARAVFVEKSARAAQDLEADAGAVGAGSAPRRHRSMSATQLPIFAGRRNTSVAYSWIRRLRPGCWDKWLRAWRRRAGSRPERGSTQNAPPARACRRYLRTGLSPGPGGRARSGIICCGGPPDDHRHALYPGTFDPITNGHADLVATRVESL